MRLKSLLACLLALMLIAVGSYWLFQRPNDQPFRSTIVEIENVKLLTEELDGTDSYWVTTSSEDAGFDRRQIQEAIATAEKFSGFYALMVIRDNKVVVERYFAGAGKDGLFQLRSITKNFTSALTGIAIAEGKLDADATVQQYFPELLDGEKSRVQVSHLLNMSSGLEWNERKSILRYVRNAVKDPIRVVLSKELVDEPGAKMNYNSMTTHVLAGILELAMESPLKALAEEKIFDPLAIENYDWESDPEGRSWGCYGLKLRARDLAKFGQLYLQGGRWKGVQVVPEAWVQQSASKQIDTGVEGGGYSNQWWYADIDAYDAPVYYGQGYGGQALLIAPDKKLVIVAFQQHSVGASSADRQWNRLVEEVVRPIYNAIQD